MYNNSRGRVSTPLVMVYLNSINGFQCVDQGSYV